MLLFLSSDTSQEPFIFYLQIRLANDFLELFFLSLIPLDHTTLILQVLTVYRFLVFLELADELLTDKLLTPGRYDFYSALSRIQTNSK